MCSSSVFICHCILFVVYAVSSFFLKKKHRLHVYLSEALFLCDCVQKLNLDLAVNLHCICFFANIYLKKKVKVRFVNISVTDGCKKSEVWMYIVGIVVLKYFLLFSIKNWSIPAIFLGTFTAQSSLWVFPELTRKCRVRHLQILIRLSSSFLSWSSFPPLEGEMWSLCFRLLPSVCVLSLFLSSNSLSICSEMFPVCYFGLSTTSRPSEQKQKKPVLLCSSATR